MRLFSRNEYLVRKYELWKSELRPILILRWSVAVEQSEFKVLNLKNPPPEFRLTWKMSAELRIWVHWKKYAFSVIRRNYVIFLTFLWKNYDKSDCQTQENFSKPILCFHWDFIWVSIDPIMEFSQHWENDTKLSNGIGLTQCDPQYWVRYPIMGFTGTNVDQTLTHF